MMIGKAKPIGVHLLLLSAMLLAPMIALAGYIVFEFASSERSRLERVSVETAHEIAASVDREHSELLTILQTLRTNPSLTAGDLAEFHKAAAVLSTLGIDVVLRSIDGQVLLHSRVPWGTALPTTTDPESIAEIRKSKQGFVSNIIFGDASNNPSFNVTLPVLVDGEVAYALSTSSNVNTIQGAIDSKVTTAQLAIILDRSGTVVARPHDPQAFAGRKLPEAFLSKIHGGETTFLEDSGDLGVMQWRSVRTTIANWPVVVGTPVALLKAPLYRGLSLIGALSMLALALGIFSARLFSVRITQAVQALSHHASMLETGENVATLLTPVTEVNAVSSKIARAASRLQMSEERLNVALAGAHAGVWDWDIRGATIEGDFYPFDRSRAKPGRISFESWVNLIHPDDRERALETFNIATRTKSDYVDEYRVLGPEPGEIRWIASRGQVLFDLDGEPIRVTGINFDITERKSNEEHIEFTMRELSHRAKNLLAVVQAMARQTARQSGTFEDFEARFSGRIQALSHAHDLLVRQDWRGVPMRDLIHLQLEAFTDVNQRVSIEGPIITLNPQAAQHFGLALHELATNASKYGALSLPAGRIAIRWSLTGNTPDRKFLFEWAEHGGPTVEFSDRRGFGTFVVERMASSGMGGDATLLFEPDGIRWRLEAPESQVLRK